MMMKALYFDRHNLKLSEVPVPEPRDDEALLKVKYSGICNTDLEILKGYMDFKGILGHEFVGIVLKSPQPEWQNKLVVGEINISCGKCEYCHQGLDRHCPYRSVLGIQGKSGIMAEYITLPLRNLHAIPEPVKPQCALFTEPLAAACEIFEQIRILSDYRVLVIGDGKLGQLIARVTNLHTSNLLVLGKHKQKLNLLNKLGIDTVHSDNFKIEAEKFQVVIEATGSWQGWELALQAVRPRGFIVLKSTYTGAHTFNPAPLVIHEITVLGSRCGPFPLALQLLAKKQVVVDDLITASFPFSEWNKAFDMASRQDSLKIIMKH